MRYCRLLRSAGDNEAKSFGAADNPTHEIRDRTCVTTRLDLEVKIDPAKPEVEGVSHITLKPLLSGSKTVEIDAREITVTKVEGPAGPLTYRKVEKGIIVDLPEGATPDQEVRISVHYHGKDPRKGLFFIPADEAKGRAEPMVWSQGEMQDNSYWFPLQDSPVARYPTAVTATVPAGYMVLSNGKLMEKESAGDWEVFKWRHDMPHPGYLVNLVVGKFDELREEKEGFQLGYFAPKGTLAKLAGTFEKTADVLKFLGWATGKPYPYPKYDQVVVHDFTWGGMENTTLTVLYDGTLVDERARPDYAPEGLIAHEAAHQWFGDLLTTKDWGHLWLNESFATYFDPLYYEHALGKATFDHRMALTAKGYFKEASSSYKRPIVHHRFDTAEDMFDAHSYNKGGWVMHMIRKHLGDEGWWKAVRTYVENNQGRAVETTDWRIAIEEATGRAMGAFFDQWVFSPGHPVLKVGFEADPKAGVVKIDVTQTQEEKAFSFPLEIDLITDTGVERHTINIKEKSGQFQVPCTGAVKAVTFDPEGWLLAEYKWKPSVDQVQAILAASKHVPGNRRAALALGEHITPAAVEVLKDILTGDQHFSVQTCAAEALGKIRTDGARTILIETLAHQESPVRRAAITALGKFRRDPVVAKALADHLGQETKDYPLAATYRSIGKVAGEGAKELLLEGLAQEGHFECIRINVVAGLAALRDPAAFPVLTEMVEDASFRLRGGVLRAIGQVGNRHADLRVEAREFLERFLRDPEFHTRRGAVEALGTLGEPEAVGELEALGTRELFGMNLKVIQDTIKAIRKGAKDRSAPAEEELDKLRKADRQLKEKVAALEDRLDRLSGKGEEGKAGGV